MLRWVEETGTVSVFRQPANHTNGNTRDWQGRLISCEHGTRRLTRTEYDGSITVLADSYQGKPLNAPTDVVVHPDGGSGSLIRAMAASCTTKVQGENWS